MSTSKRTIYQKEFIEKLSIRNIQREHQDWTKEMQEEVGKSVEWINKVIVKETIHDLAAKIDIACYGNISPRDCLDDAKFIVENIPTEAMPNIQEWIDGTEISDIKMHGVSIRDIMVQFGERRPIHFLEAVKSMIAWKNTGYKEKDYCEMYFAH